MSIACRPSLLPVYGACERAAMMYSFFGACKVKGKNPERWLAYVLDHIGSTKDEDLYKLLPEFWEDIN